MPGDEWQRFANLRLLYTYMFTHPGKKLLFMGAEFAQGDEWNSTRALDWYVLDFPFHRGVWELVRGLNDLYRAEPSLHAQDFDWQGFEWIDCNDAQRSVLVFERKGLKDDERLIVALNFTPVPREGYRIGVRTEGPYEEILNSDAQLYGGSGVVRGSEPFITEPVAWMDRPRSLVVTLPPLAGIVLKPIAPAVAPAETADSESETGEPEVIEETGEQ